MVYPETGCVGQGCVCRVCQAHLCSESLRRPRKCPTFPRPSSAAHDELFMHLMGKSSPKEKMRLIARCGGSVSLSRVSAGGSQSRRSYLMNFISSIEEIMKNNHRTCRERIAQEQRRKSHKEMNQMRMRGLRRRRWAAPFEASL